MSYLLYNKQHTKRFLTSRCTEFRYYCKNQCNNIHSCISKNQQPPWNQIRMMMKMINIRSSNAIRSSIATLPQQYSSNSYHDRSHLSYASLSSWPKSSSSSSSSSLSSSFLSRNHSWNNHYHRLFSTSTSSSSVPSTTSSSSSSTTPTSNDNSNNNNSSSSLPENIIPIDFNIQSKIIGNESQILILQLYNQQLIRTESGSLLYMTDHIHMNTSIGTNLSQGLSRIMTGQNFFITDYTYHGPSSTYGTVALGTNFPSKIIHISLQDYNINKLICQKGALLCSSHTINIQMEFTKNITTGFFGGEGFILQGLTTTTDTNNKTGDVFVKASGALIRRELKHNEQIRISSGCLVCFTEGIDYNVQIMSGGITNIIGSGEGLFITTLTGPGIVWLQGQPPDRMISEIAKRVPSGGGGMILPIPMGGTGGGNGGSSSESSGSS